MATIRYTTGADYDEEDSETYVEGYPIHLSATTIYLGPESVIPNLDSDSSNLHILVIQEGGLPFPSFPSEFTDASAGYFYDFSETDAQSFLTGGVFGDVIRTGWGNDTLRGGGGSDALYGMEGDDRFVVTSTPVKVEGGNGKDILFIDTDSGVELNDGNFDGIELIHVRSGSSLNMSGVSSGMTINSASTVDNSATIIGTSGADRIVAGKGSDTILGGAGNDKLFAGGGSNLFVFPEGNGRDNIYKFDILKDHFAFGGDVSAFTDLKIGSTSGGDAVITVIGDTDPSNKIIVHDVLPTSLTADHFMFGG
ncbi:Bifunctional hemolysin/adenylate cyclase [Methylobacterium bullatum]|uniref:Bifunctional hemolysin/adenylate cyclase n=1 Tax=Methylobacterium bullatum TaxID=570505 RepID=A0A679J8H3_9HYPH|nr:Bifunctional hemolysin/adenylate cyclase [Methylobacterium bullatum]